MYRLQSGHPGLGILIIILIILNNINNKFTIIIILVIHGVRLSLRSARVAIDYRVTSKTTIPFIPIIYKPIKKHGSRGCGSSKIVISKIKKMLCLPITSITIYYHRHDGTLAH